MPHLPTLKKRAQFLAVAKTANRARDAKQVRGALIVQAHKSEHELIRLGITASKKIGNAVVRNRAKRRLRAAAQDILPRLGEIGFDYVLVARARLANSSWNTLTHELEDALLALHKTQ